MSVFLNHQPAQKQLYPDNTLVHPYNTKVFQDYNTAVEMLMYKVLCPGEVAFAYYNDELSDYGINAIFAVGPLVHGGGNIIFKNALELQRIFDYLNTTIADVNTSINRVRCDLFNSLNDVSTRLDQALADCIDTVMGPMNIYKQQIDDLYVELYDIKVVLDTKADKSELEQLAELHDNDVTEINHSINEKYIILDNKINQQREDIIEYIQEAIRAAISQSNQDSDEILGETKTELQKAFNVIRSEYYKLFNEVKTDISTLIEKHNVDINVLHTNINNLTYQVETLNTSCNNLTESLTTQNDILLDKINDLYHRFKHHIAEHPDSFNSDL